jgi:DNA-binding response OmpR family regulator
MTIGSMFLTTGLTATWRATLMIEAAHAAARRVLLIDGDDVARGALRQVLEAAGHTVQEADDGLDGVRTALIWKPDVMVLEIGMPILDGYGVARRVRSELGASVRLIAFTGLNDRQRVLEAGFDEHLLKPTDLQRIRAMLESAGCL